MSNGACLQAASGWTGSRRWARALAGSSFAAALLLGCGGKSLTNEQNGAAGAPGGNSISQVAMMPNPDVVRTCPTSNAEWCAELASGAREVASAIAVDTQANVIIAGYTTGNLAGDANHEAASEVFVAKYTPSGELIWLREFGPDETGFAEAIATDSNDDIVVVGVRYLADPFQAGFLAKFSPQGDRLWTKQSGELGGSVAVDASQNIVWAGGTFGGATLQKYSPAGDLLWGQQLGDFGDYVTVGPQGEIILSGGQRESSASASGWLEKFTANGGLLWSTQAAVEFSLARVDGSSGDLFVIGNDNDWLLRRYTGNGDLVWNTYTDSKLFDETGIAIGPSGELFIAGMSSDFQRGGYDSYVEKLSPDGTVLAGQSLGVRGGSENCQLAVGPSGEVFVAGPLAKSAFVARVSL